MLIGESNSVVRGLTGYEEQGPQTGEEFWGRLAQDYGSLKAWGAQLEQTFKTLLPAIAVGALGGLAGARVFCSLAILTTKGRVSQVAQTPFVRLAQAGFVGLFDELSSAVYTARHRREFQEGKGRIAKGNYGEGIKLCLQACARDFGGGCGTRTFMFGGLHLFASRLNRFQKIGAFLVMPALMASGSWFTELFTEKDRKVTSGVGWDLLHRYTNALFMMHLQANFLRLRFIPRSIRPDLSLHADDWQWVQKKRSEWTNLAQEVDSVALALKQYGREHLIERAGHILTHSATYRGKDHGRVFILADAVKRPHAEMFVEAVRRMGGEVDLVVVPAGDKTGQTIQRAIKERLREDHVVFMNFLDANVPPEIRRLRMPLTSAQAAISGKNGGRVFSSPGYTFRMLGEQPDIPTMIARAEQLKEALSGGVAVHVTTQAGTDIQIGYEGRPVSHDVVPTPGLFGNIPGGEVYFAALETKADGVIVADACIDGLAHAPNTVRLKIKDGKLEKVGWDDLEEDDRWGYLAELKKILATDEQASIIGEFGMGVFDSARGVLSGRLLSDEKLLGTIHIALGYNVTYGDGKNTSKAHTDFVLRKATVKVIYPASSGKPDRVILKNGELVN